MVLFQGSSIGPGDSRLVYHMGVDIPGLVACRVGPEVGLEVGLEVDLPVLLLAPEADTGTHPAGSEMSSRREPLT